MEAQNFFGFDASGPDDEGGEGIIDEEYDALNDETFGAAVDGDWEQNHEQYANFTEAQRSQRHRNNQQIQDGGLVFDEVAAGIERLGHPSSSPMNIIGGYQHHHQHNGSGGHMGGLLGGPEIAGSPSSIWAPSPNLDKLISPVSNQPSAFIGSPPTHNHMGGMGQINQPGLGNIGLPSIKTVAELEDEMKLQQHRHNASTAIPPTVNHQNQPNPQQQQHNHQQRLQQQQEQFGLHRQGSFNGIPNNRNNQFNNRHQQRPYGNNQGSYQGGPQAGHHPAHHSHNNHHSQQQRFINNFPNNKGPPFNHHNNQFHLPPPPPPHHHLNNHHNNHHHHHDGFNNFNNQHHNYHSHHHNLQQQQHPMHHNNHRNGDGHRYFNNYNNGYDNQGRNGFDRRNFDRRSYDQNGGRFDQGKNHFDQREYGNGRDHNHLNNSNNSGRDQDLNSGGGHGHASRVRRDSEAEWDEWQRLRDQDEFCGLMTPREKSWLKNIQAMQLHTDNPYQDDYYHVMYSVKQQRKREEEVIEIDGLQLLLPDRGKDGGREYEPPRLENSLGKLQVVSVNAPRKIVDLQVVHLDPKHPTTELQREMRRHRHLLLHIEKMYTTMMEIDDLERKIRLLPDCPTRDLYKAKSKHMASDLWSVAVETPDKLVKLLSVRKGKSMISHLMRWLGEEECEQLVICACQNLSVLAKRDIHDQYLAYFWPGADRLITTSNSQRLLLLAQALLTTPVQGPHKSNIFAALSNKFGMSIVYGLLVRGEELHTELEKQILWQEFLAGTIMALTDANKITDSTKNDLAVPLPSLAVSAASSPRSQAAWKHLGRCGRIEAGSLKVAQEKLSSLDHVISKTKATIAGTDSSPSTNPNIEKQPQHS